MMLKVWNPSTGAHIYESPPESTNWTYNLEIGDVTYSFSGNDLERKVFSAFQNVSNYRRAIKNLLLFLDSEIEKIQSKLTEQVLVVNHNFVETCKHVRDPILEMLPKLSGTRNHAEKIQRVSDHLKKQKIEDIAAALLDVDRAVTNLHTQISGLEIISGEYTPQPIEHNLRALINNLFSPFERSFDEKSIRFANHISEATASENLISLDYNLLNWAFYHLLNNAVKYCRPGTEIIIKYNFEYKKLILSMTSLKVEMDEANDIFSAEVRGQSAQNNFSGDGLGMFFVKISLKRMGASVAFVPHNNTCILLEGKTYCHNEIEIQFT